MSTPPRTRADQRGADLWFRLMGLPTFVPLRRWFTDLPRRVAPLIASVTVARFLLQDLVDDAIEVAVEFFGTDEWAIFASVLVLIGIALAIAWTAYALLRGLLRRLRPPVGTTVATAAIVLCLAGLIVGGYLMTPDATVGPVLSALALVLGCVLFTGMGGGALLTWASRLAVRNVSAIGYMASIALPVILMLVVFAFFSGEVWQMASALGWRSIWTVALVVGALAVVVVLSVCAKELDDDMHVQGHEHRLALVVGTPAEGWMRESTPHRPLHRAQRINLLLVMAVAQVLQAVFFAALLWMLLVVIGAIAIPYGVVELWVGAGSASMPLEVVRIEVASATLPITVNLLKAAALLSVIATLPFVFSAVSEARYRERFFDPIMADMRRAIAVRDALRA
ncbi:hypothetical protein ACTJJ4_13960 [Microbacterium sp. 22195]|uniref:hypothetical protein n=1 Tax=Microbacterium sp. 22195 TaxID=3453891 RepID=UPI003F86F032